MDSHLRDALDHYSNGNLPLSEVYVHRYLGQYPQSKPALDLLEDIRRGYGISKSGQLSEKPFGHSSVNQRYLVIKAWGYGFWSEAHNTAIHLLLAELTGRIPVVHWGSNCLFRSDKGDSSVFENFFTPISNVRLETLPKASIYPPKWTFDNLHIENHNKWDGAFSRLTAQNFFNRPETIVISDFYSPLSFISRWIGPKSAYYGMTESALYAALFQKYLKPAPRITAMVEDFVDRHMRGRHWVSVHLRGSDKSHEVPHLENTNRRYFEFVDRIIQLNPDIGIFLLTDSEDAVNEFTRRYGNRLLCIQATRSKSILGVHQSGHDGTRVGEEVLIDTILATRCEYFVGNQESNVSLAVSSIKEWPKGFMILLGAENARSEGPLLTLYKRTSEPGTRCQLCKTSVQFQFSRKTPSNDSVNYFKCDDCGALQTDSPNQNSETSRHSLAFFDSSKAYRALADYFVVRRIHQILGVNQNDRCVDYRGGNGLFSRIMRDTGYNYFSHSSQDNRDNYNGFVWREINRPVRLVTILNHASEFPTTSSEWETIFSTGADLVIGSTPLFDDQGENWRHLDDVQGQNGFFYSSKSLSLVAYRNLREFYAFNNFFIFTKERLPITTVERLEQLSNEPLQTMLEFPAEWAQGATTHSARDTNCITLRNRMRAAKVRIALDGTFFRFASGIARVWRSLLEEWSANGFGEFVVVVDRERTAPRLPEVSYVDAPKHNYTDLNADRLLLQQICDTENVAIFTSTYYTTPLNTPAILMVHDMIPEVMGFDLSSLQWQEKHHAIRYCSHFLTVSKSTARDLVTFFPDIRHDQIVTTYGGTDFRTPTPDKIQDFKARYGISTPYFLISGVKSGYKNAVLFFQAFAKLGDERRNFSIVCTNSPPVLEPEFSTFVGEAKLHLLVLSDSELQCAYAGAIALAYPSRYEGFGLPVVEAMACSCPVITCENSSIIEVAGDAAIYVDPDDSDAMLRAMKAVLAPNVRSNLQQKGKLQAAKFSWRKMAEEVESALSEWALSVKSGDLR